MQWGARLVRLHPLPGQILCMSDCSGQFGHQTSPETPLSALDSESSEASRSWWQQPVLEQSAPHLPSLTDQQEPSFPGKARALGLSDTAWQVLIEQVRGCRNKTSSTCKEGGDDPSKPPPSCPRWARGPSSPQPCPRVAWCSEGRDHCLSLGPSLCSPTRVSPVEIRHPRQTTRAHEDPEVEDLSLESH